jgi:murein L,D-transpeptidase YcbB/YkuD
LVRDVILALLLAASGPLAVHYAPAITQAANFVSAGPQEQALRTALRAGPFNEFEPAYSMRRFRPIWFEDGRARPEVRRLIDALSTSAEDGLAPEDYDPVGLRLHVDNGDRAEAELRLTRAFTHYVADLHRPGRGATVIATDASVAPRHLSPAQVAMELANAPSAARYFTNATRVNPLYGQLRSLLAEHRASTLKAATGADRVEDLLLINMRRARGLPADLGNRYILVDVAANRLLLYDQGKPSDSMKIVVGAPDLPTPLMSGVIRYAVYNPYWNVPPDLTRNRFAPRAAADPSVVAAERMEVLSDWSDSARIIDPATVDWREVAAGKTSLRLRQRPGPRNMMGSVKFMLPNDLGVYLHDTPQKALFDRATRTASAGCVRVQDPARLSRWLFQGRTVGAVGDAPEQRVDLPQPVPVYFVYLTASPLEGGGVTLRPDIYGWDAPLLAQLPRRASTPSDPMIGKRA